MHQKPLKSKTNFEIGIQSDSYVLKQDEVHNARPNKLPFEFGDLNRT